MAKTVTQTGMVMDETIAGMCSIIDHLNQELDEEEDYARCVAIRAILNRFYRASGILREARSWYKKIEAASSEKGGDQDAGK